MPLVVCPSPPSPRAQSLRGKPGSASALFNMFRNLGGGIGIALLATQLDLREKLHSVRLGEGVTGIQPRNLAAVDWADGAVHRARERAGDRRRASPRCAGGDRPT